MSVDLLLDTSVVLWLIRGDERAAWIREVVEDAASTVSLSSVVLTEIAIKHSIGKLADEAGKVREMSRYLGMVELPFTGSHAEQLATLSLHHRDPFDRMLIAQAMSEEMTLATSDRALAAYEGLRLRDC